MPTSPNANSAITAGSLTGSTADVDTPVGNAIPSGSVISPLAGELVIQGSLKQPVST